MISALRKFPNKSLLEPVYSGDEETRNRFHEIAQVLLNESVLKIAGAEYRICEIEFYLTSAGHPDPFTHSHPEQLSFGNWYFHRAGDTLNSRYKSGKRKGLDLTIGDGEHFAGVLVRRIEGVLRGGLIEGPSLVVDHILEVHKKASIALLQSSGEAEVEILERKDIDQREWFMSPRVGLVLGNALTENDFRFLYRPYRYLVDPKLGKKGKILLFLNQRILYGIERAMIATGVRPADAEKYEEWFKLGSTKDWRSLSSLKNKSVRHQCELFGAYFKWAAEN